MNRNCYRLPMLSGLTFSMVNFGNNIYVARCRCKPEVNMAVKKAEVYSYVAMVFYYFYIRTLQMEGVN